MTVEKLARKKKFTESEKQFLRDEAARLNITFKERTRCQACFSDLAIQLYTVLHSCKPQQKSSQKYTLKPGTDITFLSSKIRICEATFTQEMGAMLERKGLKKYLV